MPYGKNKGKRAAFNNDGRYAFGGEKPVMPYGKKGGKKRGKRDGRGK